MPKSIQERLEKIKIRLNKIKTNDPDLKVWGAGDDLFFNYPGHHHHLNPVLTEEDIIATEKKLQVTIPVEYREFLKTIGDGGVGPAWGLFKLEYTYPSDEFLEEYPDICSMEFPIDQDNINTIFEKLKESREYRVPLVEAFGGYIKLNTYGHDLSAILIMSGYDNQTGTVWILEDNVSFIPMVKEVSGSFVQGNFLDWYEEWLDETEQEIAGFK